MQVNGTKTYLSEQIFGRGDCLWFDRRPQLTVRCNTVLHDASNIALIKCLSFHNLICRTSTMEAYFSSKSYLCEAPAEALAFVDKHAAALAKEREHPYLPPFRLEQSIVVVHLSNQEEASLPKSVSASETAAILSSFLTSDAASAAADEEPTPWLVEDSTNRSERRQQLVQHIRALMYLEKMSEPLTPELVLTTHGILLRGAYEVNESGDTVAVAAGTLRKDIRYNGAYGHQAFTFTAPEAVSDTLKAVCHKFNAMDHWLTRASYLLYALLATHPFENGNGRLARLFWWWSLRNTGHAPFPVMLSSGHKKARAHYINAVKYADNHVGSGEKERLRELNSLAIGALHRAWKMYLGQAALAKDGSLI